MADQGQQDVQSIDAILAQLDEEELNDGPDLAKLDEEHLNDGPESKKLVSLAAGEGIVPAEFEDGLAKWGARGLPVHRVHNFDGTCQLARDLDFIDQMSNDELIKRYTDMGYPNEKSMPRAELVQFLQMLLCWFAMPLDMIQEEIRMRNMKVDNHVNGKDEEIVRDEEIDRLLRYERLKAWDARGYQAQRLGKFSTVLQVVTSTEFFISMDAVQLKEYYEAKGYPLGDGSCNYLHILKYVIILEALPMAELEAELTSKGISLPTDKFDDDSQRKNFCIRLLIVNLLRATYVSKGLPVDVLGLEQATRISKRFDIYETFEAEELIGELEHIGMPAPSHVGREELLIFLRQLTVWPHLSVASLWSICGSRGLIMNGFDLKMPELDLKERLLVRLIAQWRAKRMIPTTDKLSSGWLEVHMNAISHCAEVMRDPIMCERICNIPARPMPTDFTLPKKALHWQPIEAALFILSERVFDPAEEQRQSAVANDDGKVLMSVVCPTTEKRQHFHPLLYANFIRQSHEPKELVIVETGSTPSCFFVEKALQDTRVVYRHYAVDDASFKNNNGSRRHEVEWSLGLKRNIACCLAKGVVIAQFDDDDMYAQNYLSWMLEKLREAAPRSELQRPVAAKLTGWHLLDISTSDFGFLDVQTDKTLPAEDRRGWLYGWGFSYVFSRAAWELCPFPDVEFAEDAGFYEGLLLREIPVSLLRYPEEFQAAGLVSHTHHVRSTSGGSGVTGDGLHRWNQSLPVPKQFLALLPMLKRVHRFLNADEQAKAQLHDRTGADRRGTAQSSNMGLQQALGLTSIPSKFALLPVPGQNQKPSLKAPNFGGLDVKKALAKIPTKP